MLPLEQCEYMVDVRGFLETMHSTYYVAFATELDDVDFLFVAHIRDIPNRQLQKHHPFM